MNGVVSKEVWTSHFFLSSRKLKMQIWGSDPYICGTLQHKGHSWNVERGRCSGLVFATPALTHLLLVFLSYSPGTLTKSFPGILPARAPRAAWFLQVCVHFWCDSEQLPVTGRSNFQWGRHGGAGAWVLWDNGGRVSRISFPASWSVSDEQRWLAVLGFSAGCMAAGFISQPSFQEPWSSCEFPKNVFWVSWCFT